MKNLKKVMVFILIMAASCIVNAITASAAAEGDFTIDTAQASKGAISVKYNGSMGSALKAQVVKGDATYTYDIPDNNKQTFPLQSGAGEYTINIFENLSGSKYRVVTSQTVSVSSISDKDVFTQSIQLINFNGTMVSIKELNAMVASVSTDTEKLNLIYEFIVSNFSYDYDKAAIVAGTSGYIPVIDTVYASKKGICYDYASLFAAILRANNIPTKLQMGYFTEVDAYHSWNQVLVDGSWVNIDTTYDSQAKSYNISYSMKKDSSNFKVVYQY